MGMFNRVYVPCPKCGKSVEFQTKSGSCLLESFSIENAPESELVGIGTEKKCECGELVKPVIKPQCTCGEREACNLCPLKEPKESRYEQELYNETEP